MLFRSGANPAFFYLMQQQPTQKLSAAEKRRLKKKNRDRARKLGETALKQLIEQKDWSRAALDDVKGLKCVVFELGRLEYPCIDPEISMLRKERCVYVVTVSGWAAEVDAHKMYVKMYDPRTRSPNMHCVTEMYFNPAACVVKVEINTALAHLNTTSESNSRARMPSHQKRIMRVGDRGQSRAGVVRKVTLRSDVKLDMVEPQHRPAVTNVLIGVLDYLPTMPRMPAPQVLAPKGIPSYKLIFKEMNVELELGDVYRRMLCPDTRDPAFQFVETVGFDQRTQALVVRVKKMERVNQKTARRSARRSSRLQQQRQRQVDASGYRKRW